MSWHSALVDDNDDPDRLGRLKLVVPALWGDAVYDAWVPMLGGLGAAEASDGEAAGAGMFWIPPAGSIVLVLEVDGRLAWTGGGWGRTNALPSQLAANYPDRAGWTSPGGAVWVAADDVDGLHLVAEGDGDAGNARLAASGDLALVGDGGVEVVPGAGQWINLTSTAGSTPTDRVLLGNAFLQDLASVLTELVTGLSSIPSSSAQTAAMLVKVNLALADAAPYLSAITRTD